MKYFTPERYLQHDLHATLLHCLGIDRTRLTFKFQGRHHRLTDVHGNVVREVLPERQGSAAGGPGWTKNLGTP